MVVVDRDRQYEEVGALDLNVKPDSAEVFLNGHSIGEADDFDGFPKYLWLEEGVYELIFFKEGYETVRRTYEVRSGMEINVRIDLEHGEAVPAQQLSLKNLEPPSEEDALADDGMTDDGSHVIGTGELAYARPPAEALDTREGPAHVKVAVSPADASVYLDGQFLGTGEQLAGYRGQLLVDAGAHKLEVVHPSFVSRELSFEVAAGEEVALEVPALEPKSRDTAAAER